MKKPIIIHSQNTSNKLDIKVWSVLILIAIPSFLFSQYIPDTIYSQVNGNYVKVFDNGAMRVCGTVYEHIVLKEDSISFRWNQALVSSMPVYCVCTITIW